MEKTITEIRPAICEHGIGKFKTFNIGIKKVRNEEQYECYSFTIENPKLTDILPRIVANALTLSDKEVEVIKAECQSSSWPQLVSSMVRACYSADDVEAIILNHGDGDEKHEAEYNALQEWRKEVKSIAKKFIEYEVTE